MSTLPVLRGFFACGTRTKGASIPELKRDRGNTDVRSPMTLPPSAFLCLWPPRSSLPTSRLAYSFIAFHVKTWTNFSRVLVSLERPYFHTQGGLQKYVGGATSDVTSVRGLADDSTQTPILNNYFTKTYDLIVQDGAFRCTLNVVFFPHQHSAPGT